VIKALAPLLAQLMAIDRIVKEDQG
jgi:hypothetical protein